MEGLRVFSEGAHVIYALKYAFWQYKEVQQNRGVRVVFVWRPTESRLSTTRHLTGVSPPTDTASRYRLRYEYRCGYNIQIHDTEYTSIAGCPTLDCRSVAESGPAHYRNPSMHSTARGRCVTVVLRNNQNGIIRYVT
jgi:hypothetical protein